MDLLQKFVVYLQSQKTKPSPATVKNYKADIGQFIKWFEDEFKYTFEPKAITPQIIGLYKSSKQKPNDSLASSSLKRHLSSLRKFFYFLKITGVIAVSPLEQYLDNNSHTKDPWHIKEFKNYLYVYNASNLTIKNYIIDVAQFLKWAEEVTRVKHAWNTQQKNVLGKINGNLLETYKNRLLTQTNLSPVSINRKLSSLRKYIRWLTQEKLIQASNEFLDIKNYLEQKKPPFSKIMEASQSQLKHLKGDKMDTFQVKEVAVNQNGNQTDQLIAANHYSIIPPIRLFQKLMNVINFFIDTAIVIPLAKSIQKTQTILWKAKGQKLFYNIAKDNSSTHKDSPTKSFEAVTNIKKEFYAPVSISTKYFPLHKKLLFNLLHSRPKWYIKYRSYAITHYFHLSILVIFMSVIGFSLYNNFVKKPQEQPPALAAATSPTRILSFQGRLTDASDNPITSTKQLRFVIYNDITASGSARLWEEVRTISPDTNGIFSIFLGDDTSTHGNAALCNSGNPPDSPATGACGIPQSLFAQNDKLWLGVTITNDPELTPRQQLATVAYATNAEVLQGLPPITQANAGTTNVVLALDSSGNLTIGDTAAPTFQASGGQFKLMGQPLVMETNVGSNGNIVLNPDGSGKIDLQKPLQNTSLSNNITSAAGAVEVDDLFAILATSSGQSALTINQTSTGPLISASVSGIAKFTVDNSGNLTTAGTITSSTINGQTISSSASFTGTVGVTTSLTSPIIYGGSNSNSTLTLAGTSNGTPSNAHIFLNGSGQGNVGIGTTAPLAAFDTRGINATSPTASVSANSNFAALVADNRGNGDIFTASASGAPRLTVTNGGNIQLGGTNPAISAAGTNSTLQLNANGTGTLTLNSGATGNIQFFSSSNTLSSSGNLTLAGTISLPNSNTLTGNSSYITANNGISVGGATTYYINNLGTANLNAGTFAGLITANAGISLAANQNLTLAAGTGNIGVGTTSTLGTLDVRGNLGTVPAATISANSSFAALVVDNKGSGDIFTASSSGLNRFVITQNGNVGVGTNLPTAGLHIANNGVASAPGVRLDGTWFTGGSATTTKPQLLVEPTSTTSTNWSTSGTGIGINATSGFAGNLLDFQRDGTRVARMDYAGGLFLSGSYGLTVGADTSPTGGFLEVTGANPITYTTSSGTGYALMYYRNGSNTTVVAQNDNGSIGSGTLNQASIFGSTSNQATQFLTNNLPRMTIDTSGNIGIGATAPTGLLHINGAPTGKALTVLNYTGNDQNIFTASTSGNTRFTIANDGSIAQTATTVAGNANVITANSITSGVAASVSATALTSGTLLGLTPPNPSSTFTGNIINAASANHTYMTLNNRELTIGGHTNYTTISNIVKVYVYDTAKDIDGGRWTDDERARSSSWYNETLNVASVRGSTRPFPKKAIIIAASNNVYIYDAKDNALWMQFNKNSPEQMIGLTNATSTSIFALNGRMYLGNSGSSGGLYIVDFRTDTAYRYNSADDYIGNKTIANRNSAITWSPGPSGPIMNSAVNGIHAAVVKGKTYVAVMSNAGTASGINIINETDNTVALNGGGESAVAYSQAFILPNGNFYAFRGARISVWYDITSITNGFAITTRNATYINSTTSFPAIRTNSWGQQDAIVTQGTSTVDGKSNTIYIATNGELNVLQEKQGDEANGSMKYYTRDNITEEMVGTIAGMWPIASASASTYDAGQNIVVGGRIADLTTRQRDLVVKGATATFASGVKGTGLTLNGTNFLCADYSANCTTNDTTYNPTSALTVSAWVNFSTPPGNQATMSAIAKDNVGSSRAYSLGITNQGGGIVPTFFVNNNGGAKVASGSAVLSANTWYHLVGTYDGTNITLYVNGNLAGITAATGNITTSTAPFTIGAYGDASNNGKFIGTLDEPTITLTTMTAAQIKNMYNVGYRALQNHTANTLRGVSIGADYHQAVYGASGNNIKGIDVNLEKGLLYLGTAGSGVSIIGIDSDTLLDLYNSSGGFKDDTNTAWASANDTQVSVSVSKGYGTGNIMAFASSGALWMESNNTEFKDFLATAYNPFGSNLTQSVLNVDNTLRVVNQISSRFDNFNSPTATSSAESYLAEVFKVDSNGNLLSRSLFNSTTAMQFQNAAATTLFNLDTTGSNAVATINQFSSTGDIFTASASGTNRFVIRNSGNVGIGTNLPVGVLHLSGIAAGNAAAIINQAGSIGDIFTASSSGTPRFVINNAGNVGINTTLPIATLDVRGNLGTTPTASVSANSSFAALVVDNKGSGDLFTASSSGLNRFVIKQNGNVGISTTTPAYTLDVAGSIRTTDAFVFSDGSTQGAADGDGFAWHVTTAVASKTKTVTSEEANPYGIAFKPDGTKMYIVGFGTDEVNEYNLSTPWDVSTATAYQVKSVTSEEGTPTGLAFKPDGTKMYIVGQTGVEVNEYNLSTPWDVSTATASKVKSLASEEAYPNGIAFKPDGTKMYVIGAEVDEVNEYNLSTPWDVSTAVFSQLKSVTSQESGPQDIAFKPDGTKMYIVGTLGVEVNEYNLSTPWDVSTAVFSQLKSVTSEDTTPVGLAFKPDGTRMYVVGDADNEVNEYNLGLSIDGSTYINGNVGIGTTAPSGVLHLSGIAAGNAAAIFNQAGSVGDIFTASASGTNKFVIRNNGNVGIGTNLPLAALDVRGNLGTTPTASISANSSFAGLVVDNKGSGDIFTASSSGLNRFVITQNGNVGIGTATPAYKVDVNGILNATTIYQNGSPLSTSQWTTASNDIYYTTGNVGIGTTSPLAAFDVRALNATTPAASVSANSNFAALVVDNRGSGELFVASSSGLNRFVITQNGSIGIGTTLPKYNLDLYGISGGRLSANSSNSASLTLLQAGSGNLLDFKTHLPGVSQLSIQSNYNELSTIIKPKSALEFRFKSSVTWTAKTAWDVVDIGNLAIPAFADLDNDGDYDLLIGEGGGVSKGYENTGSASSPTWTAKTAWDAPDIGSNVFPAFADLDNDGDYDLLIGELNGTSKGYENTGSASSPAWTAKTAWNTPDTGTNSSPAFADLDNDGDYDLLIGDNSGVFKGYENTGSASSPTWTAKTAWDIPDVGDRVIPAFADLDNDGDYDLLIGENLGTSKGYENTGSNSSVFFGNNGNVGIGTSTPSFGFDLQNSTAATAAAQIYNTNTGANASGLIVKLGFTGNGTAVTSQTAGNSFIRFLNGNGVAQGAIDSNAAGGVVYNTGGIDFAEYIKKDNLAETFTAGDLVCIGSNGGATKCQTPSNDTQSAISHTQIIGVVSDRPGFVGGSSRAGDPTYVLVGMLGQLPVKIASNSATINPGDNLTFSKIPGFATKATKAGFIIGRALGTIDSNNTLMTSVQPTWFDPDVYLSNTGDILLTKNTDVELTDIPTPQPYVLTNPFGAVTDRIGIFAQLVVANLKAGSINAEEIATKTLSIDGKNLRDYIAMVVGELATTYHLQPTALVSPIASTDRLLTNVISPLAENGDVVVKLASSSAIHDSRFMIQDASGSAVATIDSTGNATFSGNLIAKDGQFNNVTMKQLNNEGDASIAGTLRADKIIANSIEGLEAQIATIAAGYVTNLNHESGIMNQATDSSELLATNAGVLATTYDLQPTTSIDISSYSAQLASVDNLTATFGTFTQGLMALGPSSLADVSITGQLSVGAKLAITDTTINVLGADLELQPLRQGGVSFLSGLVHIDTDGNLSVNGNATFAKDVAVKGKLAANIISPLADNDLTIQLSGHSGLSRIDSGVANAPQNDEESKFVIKNASNSSVLTLNQTGDLIASGAGNFKDIIAKTFNVVRGAQADTSFTETIATASAGTATIITGETQRTIISPFVTDKSLIYITPTSDTQGNMPYVARQTAQDLENGTKGSFTIQIPNRTYQDITVNWWIIN